MLRAGCLLIPLLFADWADDLLATVLPEDPFPVYSASSQEPAILLAFKYRHDLLQRATGGPEYSFNASILTLRPAGAWQFIEGGDRLSSAGNLIYLQMSLQC